MDPEKTFQSIRRRILGNQWMDGDGYVYIYIYMCNDDEDDDDDDDDDEDDEDDEDEDDDYDDDHHHDFDYDRKVNVFWLIGMPVQRFSSQNNSWIFAEPTILQMRLHARCKLLVSDNILSTHVRPRQRSDVPRKYCLALAK